MSGAEVKTYIPISASAPRNMFFVLGDLAETFLVDADCRLYKTKGPDPRKIWLNFTLLKVTVFPFLITSLTVKVLKWCLLKYSKALILLWYCTTMIIAN